MQDAPETVIVAMDEASLYLQATPMAVWGPRGQPLVMRCEPSRTKTSFYGALNLKTGQVLAQEVAQMTAATTASYLESLLSRYPEVPLLLLWDRAPWHRGEQIREVLAANPRLEIVTFPTAAPDLKSTRARLESHAASGQPQSHPATTAQSGQTVRGASDEHHLSEFVS